MKIIISLLFFFSSFTFAQNISYIPYQFTQQGLSDRADLKKLAAKNTIVVPQSSIANLVSFDLPPIRHVLDKDLLAFYQTIYGAQPIPPISILDLQCNDIAVALQAKPINLDPKCNALEIEQKTALEELFVACNRIQQPELFVYEQKPGSVNEADLKTVEGLIKTAGEALTHINYPDGVIKASIVTDIRKIIRKVRFQPTLKILNASRDRVTKAKDAIAKGNCFAKPEDLTTWLNSNQGWNDVLAKLLNYYYALDVDGKKQAEADKAAIEKLGRKRGVLPLPNITDKERILLTAFVSGIYWRMRGGGLIDFPPGTNETRRLYTKIPFTTLTDFNCGPDCASLGKSIGSAQVLALQLKGWGDFFDLGRTGGGEDRYHDMAQMVNRGFYQVESTSKQLKSAGYDPLPFTIAGSQMGACYDLGWEKLSGIDVGVGLQPPYARFIQLGTEWGEFCFGFVLGKGLSESLLHGRKK